MSEQICELEFRNLSTWIKERIDRGYNENTIRGEIYYIYHSNKEGSTLRIIHQWDGYNDETERSNVISTKDTQLEMDYFMDDVDYLVGGGYLVGREDSLLLQA